MSDPAELDRLVAEHPPPARPRRPVLEMLALIAALVALISFGLLLGALTGFSGDWDGELVVRGGRGGVWFTVERASAYLVPLLTVLIASAVATFAALIVLVTGRRARGLSAS